MAARIISTLGFLSLLGLNQAADQHCEDLTKPLVLEDDYSSIMGKWIFTEGIADHYLFTDILKTLSSSWIEFAPSSLKDTLILRQGNKLNGTCEFQTVNSTFKNNTIHTTEKGVTSVGDFLLSSPGSMTISFSSQMQNVTIKTIYFFMRKPEVSESEKDLYWKQAECLGFKKEHQFSYDGVSEFCKDEKNSTSTDETKPDEKKVD